MAISSTAATSCSSLIPRHFVIDPRIGKSQVELIGTKRFAISHGVSEDLVRIVVSVARRNFETGRKNQSVVDDDDDKKEAKKIVEPYFGEEEDDDMLIPWCVTHRLKREKALKASHPRKKNMNPKSRS